MSRLLLPKNFLLIVFLLVAPLIPGLPNPIQADIFRFQDEKGVVHFSNVPSNSSYKLFYKEYEKTKPSPSSKGSSKTFTARSSAVTSLPLLTPHIDEASQQYGIDPKLIQAVIHVESNFDPQALSPKGAQGLMQLMPQTARDLQVSNAFSPRENINGGTRYLRYLLDLFNQDMSLALAAYNAGPERVNQYQGIPPYQETRTYVQKVTQIYNQLKSSFLTSRQ
jgi:soluble lytic murein transglycosylase-like protein